MKLRNMGELFKLGILAFCLSISAQANPNIEIKDGEDRREHIIPATVWSDYGVKELHLLVPSPGTRSSYVSKMGSFLSVSSLMSGLSVAPWLSAFYTGIQLVSYGIPWPNPVYLLNKEKAEMLEVRVPYMDFFHFRQVMVGRRNRIEHEGEMVKATPMEAQLKIKEERLVHAAFEMEFATKNSLGEKTIETKMVALRDIHFQGPAGSIGLCKTALTAIGLLR